MQKSVIEYLLRTVQLYPNKVAIHDSKGVMTFTDIYENGLKIAQYVIQSVDKCEPIPVYLPKGGWMVMSFVAVGMAADFYIPLDIKSPNNRILTILNELQARCVITDREHFQQLTHVFQGKIIVIEDCIENPILETYNRLDKQIDTDPVYTIFTSGSTGVPKGVVITHRAVIDYIDQCISAFGINSDAIFGNQAPFYFDNSIFDIYLTLATGATLDVIPEHLFAFPTSLVDYLNVNKINFVFWVPSMLTSLANSDVLKNEVPKYLDNIFFCGEIMPCRTLNKLKSVLPSARYCNMYGPTEITDVCTWYIVDRDFEDQDTLPIGRACPNTEILILVDRKHIAKEGEQGELCVRGTSLSMGYYNNSTKTNEAFIQNPLHNHYPETIYCTGDLAYINERNEIIILGRKDQQIKHNGYRIELGEIENGVLSVFDDISECCCVYHQAESKIILYYQSDSDVSILEFRKRLPLKLPKYMIPHQYIRQEAIKHNANSKIDRAYYNKLANA